MQPSGKLSQKRKPIKYARKNDVGRKAPVGHFFQVITRGYGAMPDYAQQIPARDRWAIIAYIRALQESQNTELKQIPDEEQRRLQAEAKP